MKRIKTLSARVANQIAAGEVVERPASVLKELLENSLDAKATSINIQVLQGGLSSIRVQDNGEGIVKEDLSLSLARHATSKVIKIDDLNSLLSLGFRGEALASIVSVAKCVITSKPANQEQAWSVAVKGDELEPYLYPAPCYDGTIVEVRDLFYNTPARRKFLKSVRTELNHIELVVKLCAMSHPKVGFTLTHNEKKIKEYKACKTIDERVKQITSNKFMENSYYFEYSNAGYCLKGWLGNEHTLRKSSDCQYFFINARSIRDKLINHAIKNGYFQLGVPVDQGFTSYVLFLESPLDEVDINVHPTKHEVRFSDPSFVHDYIQKCVTQALESSSKPQLSSELALLTTAKGTPSKGATLPYRQEQESSFSPTLSLNLEVYKPKARPKHIFWKNLYFSFGEQIEIIDLKQDKNKIWEMLLKQTKENPIPSRLCLFPVPLRGNLQNIDALVDFGFDIKKNIQDQLILQEVPCFLDENQIKQVADLIQNTKGSLQQIIKEYFQSLTPDVFAKNPYFEIFLEAHKSTLARAMDAEFFQNSELESLT